MRFFLIYNQFYSFDDNTVRKIGGIETYMEFLSLLLLKLNHKPIICQLSKQRFVKEDNGIEIRGYNANNIKELYSHIEKGDLKDDDFIIFMNDRESLKLKRDKNMSIQHGISWDIPYNGTNSFISFLKRIKSLYVAYTCFNRCKYSVCVDYNFYNWYKTIYAHKEPENMWIIPNFSSKYLSDTEIKERHAREEATTNILFARRFESFRGSLLFANVMAKILRKYPNVKLTLAGEGTLKEQIREILKDFSDRVVFTKYLPQESFEFHKKFDIAVVPTLGSEGTSLSLLEAMGAGCVVVATPVGGMSNILIDEFNGYISMPNEHDLEQTIEKAIYNKNNIQIINNAINSIKNGFSLEIWEKKWTKVFNSLA